MRTPFNGWVGLGISETGNMKDCDYIMGYVNSSGYVFIEDRVIISFHFVFISIIIIIFFYGSFFK